MLARRAALSSLSLLSVALFLLLLGARDHLHPVGLPLVVVGLVLRRRFFLALLLRFSRCLPATLLVPIARGEAPAAAMTAMVAFLAVVAHQELRASEHKSEGPSPEIGFLYMKQIVVNNCLSFLFFDFLFFLAVVGLMATLKGMEVSVGE